MNRRLSLVLCMATLALWVRSHYVDETLVWGTWGRADAVSSSRGMVVVELLVSAKPMPGLRRESCSPGKMPRTAEEMGASADWKAVGIEWSPAVNLYGVSFLWLAVLTAALPVCAVVSRSRASRRGQLDGCVNCGYDLRASPDRCPECGAVKKN